MVNYTGACFVCIKSDVIHGGSGVNEHHDLGSIHPLKLGSMITLEWGLRNSTGGRSETCWNL